MKAKHVFTTLGLALVMGIGVGVGVLHSNEVKPADATGNTTLYCKMEYSWWTVDSAAVAVHYWGGSSGTSYPGERGTSVGDNTWQFEVPSDSTGFMFVRVNGGTGAVSDWGAKTADLTFVDGKNLYTITSSEAVWGNPGVTGEWSVYNAPVTYSVDVYVEGEKRGTEQIAEGGLPTEPSIFGKTFVGWYDDVKCTDGHEVTAITSDTTVYAKAQLLPQWSYEIDTSRVSTVFTHKYLYAWEDGGKKNAEWPGVAMNDSTIVIPYDAKFIVVNSTDGTDAGVTAQTVDITQSCKANDILRIQNETEDRKYKAAWKTDYTVPAEDGYYICGEFSSNPCWNYEYAEKMTDTTGENVAYELNFTLAVGDELRVRSFYSDRTPNDQWATLGDNGYADPTTGWGEKSGDNFKATKAGSYDIYAKYEAEQFMFYVAEHYVEPEYTIKIDGGAALVLAHNEGTEYKCENVDLSSGEQITVYADGVQIAGMLPKAIRNNNMQNNAFNKVLVDAEDADIYVDVNAKTIWVSGMVTGGYHILKNGHELVQMTPADEYEGFTQYCSELLTFAANDTVEFIDAERTGDYNSLPVVFHIGTINAGGLGENFELVTGVITCKTACQASVYMKLKSGLDEVYFGQVEQYIADATAFAEGFNTAIGAVCKNDGSTVRSDLETAWANQATAFAALSEQAQAAVKEGSLSSVEAIRDCAAKYESVYRLRKLGSGWDLADFLDMQLSSRTIGLSVNANNTILLVVVISSVAIIASLGLTFYFLRKRKYSK